MATDLQKRTLDKTVEYGGKGKKIVKGHILREVGASEAVIKTPQKVFESKGFLQLCDELGLTDNFLTEALVADIKGKPKKREKELRLAFQVRGRLKDTDGGHTNNYFINNLTVEQQRKLAAEIISPSEESERESDRISNSDESTI